MFLLAEQSTRVGHGGSGRCEVVCFFEVVWKSSLGVLVKVCTVCDYVHVQLKSDICTSCVSYLRSPRVSARAIMTQSRLDLSVSSSMNLAPPSSNPTMPSLCKDTYSLVVVTCFSRLVVPRYLGSPPLLAVRNQLTSYMSKTGARLDTRVSRVTRPISRHCTCLSSSGCGSRLCSDKLSSYAKTCRLLLTLKHPLLPSQSTPH